MNDVFDEELMKELGLDPEDLNEGAPKPKSPPPRPAMAKPVAPGGAGASGMPSQPAQGVAPRPAARPNPAPKPGITPRPTPKLETPQPEPKEDVLPEKPMAPKAPVKDPEPVSAQSQAKKLSHEIPIQMAAVLAKKTVNLSDVLSLNVGEVLSFKKSPNEPLDLVANGKLVAKAELVVVEGKLGVRILKLVR